MATREITDVIENIEIEGFDMAFYGFIGGILWANAPGEIQAELLKGAIVLIGFLALCIVLFVLLVVGSIAVQIYHERN